MLDTLSESEHQNLLIQWDVFYRWEEKDVFYHQNDDAFDDVDSLVTDAVFLKQMTPHNSRLLFAFVQALLKHPDMNSVSG